MNRRTLFHTEDHRLRVAEDRLFLALSFLIRAGGRGGPRTDQDVRSLVFAAWSLAQGYCALRVQGTLDRQFVSTPQPTIKQVVAALVH
jgi:hypothetical protein